MTFPRTATLEVLPHLPQAKSLISKVSTTLSPFDLWHRRCAHPNKDVAKHLPEAVKGVSDVSGSGSGPCEGCAKGKQHRIPFKDSAKRATAPLELVHTDIDGPMRTQSIDGFSYFVSFIDDYSGYAGCYFLKHKSMAIEAFKQFKALAENQLDWKIKAVRSDRGGEYTSHVFSELLAEHGIQHFMTMPHTPQIL